jgi:VanZ family protein
MRATLVGLGWLYAGLIAFLSLAPAPPETGYPYGDKVGHFLAYALLMVWFARLYPARRARFAYALLWLAYGIGLEFAQQASGYRSFELADMAANALGIAAGAAAALILPRASGAGGTGTR